MARTPTERKRDERKRKRDQGLIQIQLWIKPQYKERIIRIIEGLNKSS